MACHKGHEIVGIVLPRDHFFVAQVPNRVINQPHFEVARMFRRILVVVICHVFFLQPLWAFDEANAADAVRSETLTVYDSEKDSESDLEKGQGHADDIDKADTVPLLSDNENDEKGTTDSDDDAELPGEDTRYFVVVTDNSDLLANEKYYGDVLSTIRKMLAMSYRHCTWQDYVRCAPEKTDWRIFELFKAEFSGLSDDGESMWRDVKVQPKNVYEQFTLRWKELQAETPLIGDMSLVMDPKMVRPAMLFFVKSGPLTKCIVSNKSGEKWAKMQMCTPQHALDFDVTHDVVRVELFDLE